MTPLAWLLGLVLPACGGTGAERVPVPPALDLAHLERPATPNTALAAPPDAGVRADVPTSRYPVPGPQLLATVEQVAGAMPRTFRLGAGDEVHAQWVVRSAVWNFPDIVSLQVFPRGAGASTLALYSRSIYGHSDLGVNRRRVEAWLAALNASLPPER